MALHSTSVCDSTSQKDHNGCMFLQDLTTANSLSSHSNCAKIVPGFQPALRELTEIVRKKDVDITNLSKCKVELSETVVSLKQEVYALRKEKLNSEKEGKESRSKLLMISERNAALVQELSKLNLENQRLKMEMLTITKEKCKPLLYSPDVPFNTYPWLFPREPSIPPFLSSPIYPMNNSLVKPQNSEIESCEEVSQKLFAQMKLEMKREMEELDKQLALDGLSENENVCESCVGKCDSGNLQGDYALDDVEMIEDDIQRIEDIAVFLEHEFVAIKLYALEQNKLVRELLQKVLNLTKANSPVIGLQSNERMSDPLHEYSEVEVTDNRFQFPRPSDESFRAYFTQQLSSSQQLPLSGSSRSISEERLRTLHAFSGDNRPSTGIHKPKAEIKQIPSFKEFRDEPEQQSTTTASDIFVNNDTTVKAAYPVVVSKRVSKTSEECKVCPMCQAGFPKNTAQDEFEAHVFTHFEAENSILDNFEVL